MSRSSGLRGTAHLCNCGVQTRGRGVFFEIANQGYLPALIPRADLVEGNSKLEVSRSVAQVAGPAIAGLLLPAARAILIDAASIRVVLSTDPMEDLGLHGDCESGQQRGVRRLLDLGLPAPAPQSGRHGADVRVGCPPSAVAGRGHHLSPLPVQLQAEPWS